MQHVTDEQLYTHLFDHESPSVAKHLAGCAACYQTLQTLTDLLEMFTHMRLSEPTSDQLARYCSLLRQTH